MFEYTSLFLACDYNMMLCILYFGVLSIPSASTSLKQSLEIVTETTEYHDLEFNHSCFVLGKFKKKEKSVAMKHNRATKIANNCKILPYGANQEQI